MIIDVSERIETTARLTQEWAEAAGYKQPPPEPAGISKKANDIRRILGVSDFGCQARNVHALCEALIGEAIPAPTDRRMADYATKAPFAIGSALFSLRAARVGIVTRLSARGYAGLRKSNGELFNNHYQQHDLRPATREEIEAYYSEHFGLTVNEADTGSPDDDGDAEVPV